jgi:hypothetical protein
MISVLLGALVLQETLDKEPPWHSVVAVGCLGLGLLGAVVVSSAREGEHDDDTAGATPDPVPAA